MMPLAGIAVFGLDVPLEVAVLGLVTGLTYAILGVGIVLIYKSSRVLNFAHGEMGALGASLVPVLVVNELWNYWLAVAVALLVGAGTGAFTELVVMRKLRDASRLMALVATIGVAQLFFAIGFFIPKGGDLGSAVFPTPFETSLTVGSLRLGSAHLLILLVIPAATAALFLFLRQTSLGLGARAAAENRNAAILAGVSVGRVSLAIWVIAGVLATVSAILSGPMRPVVSQVALGPSLMLRALVAAMIGGMSSLPRAFAGGVAVGLVEMAVRWNYPTGGVLEIVLFVLILASLLLQRGLGQLARGGEGSSWSMTGSVRELAQHVATHPRVRRLRIGTLTAVLAAATVVALPMNNSQRVLLAGVALFAVMGLSLVVLTGFAGQISLGQFAFVGVGALAGGRLHQLGYSPWMSLFYVLVAGALLAMVIGLPALRVRGLFLAVATLGFAIAGQTWFYEQDWLVHVVGGRTSLEIPRPQLLGIDLQSELYYYWLSLAVLVLLIGVVHRIRRTGIGRAMMAVRDNEPMAASLGVSPRRTKLLAFTLSGMIAALGGYLYGGLLVNFSDPATFGPDVSLALVGMVILGGVSSITGAVLGALWMRGLGFVLGPLLPQILGANVIVVIGGLGLLVAVLQFPGGIASVVFAARDSLVRRLVPDAEGPDAADVSRPRLPPRAPHGPREIAGIPALHVTDISVAFVGNVAVADVSMHAEQGEIVGLVGPNGAGKTTLFDVLSGHRKPDSGTVWLEGHDVTRLRPERRAALGLGRTFQQARLFGEMSLREALKVAVEREEPAEVVPSLLGLPPSRAAERRKDVRADELLELLGLRPFAHVHVSELSTGMRRLAELGTIIALGARVVLLDEPTAGIAQREVEAFRPVLQDVRAHLDATLIIIEHDIPLIMDVVDRLYVLSAGRLIASGEPAQLREDPAVIAAYLGTDERVIQRSGSDVALTVE